jgi:hypothetical protein
MTAASSRKGSGRSAPQDSRIEEYEYFQLYDPEDSDIADEADPDVRNLLSDPLNNLRRRRSIKNGIFADLFRACCSLCACFRPYSW